MENNLGFHLRHPKHNLHSSNCGEVPMANSSQRIKPNLGSFQSLIRLKLLANILISFQIQNIFSENAVTLFRIQILLWP